MRRLGLPGGDRSTYYWAMRLRIRVRRAVLAAGAAIVLTTSASAAGSALSGIAAGMAAGPFGHSGRWITDSAGRVVVVHGLNQVYKVPPYTPSADGFSDDDAAFLAANGFNAVRVGVIWGAVEPQPGRYDDGYLNSIALTVQTLANHGVVSLLDFHQDLYNEAFQGEGAPGWAVQSGGLPNPALGFPGNYLGNPAMQHAWDQFWANAPAADGIGLQDHFAAAWAHVAGRFRADPRVLGDEVLNEPWPGTVWQPCGLPAQGCPGFDGQLTAFTNRVDAAIRRADPVTPVWFEPNVLLDQSDVTRLGAVTDPRTGFAFHDYCDVEDAIGTSAPCGPRDDAVFAAAQSYAGKQNLPELMTEFGATNDLADLAAMTARADRNQVGWLEWAYTGHDKTSSSPDGQALVFDPSQPPVGANVNVAKLAVLAEPYPKLVAGTPQSWAFNGGAFALTYSTARADGAGAFAAGSETDIAVPAINFPHGYTTQVTGGQVGSAPNAATLQVVSAAGSSTVTVAVTPTP